MKKKIVIFDLDDTLYKEIDYLKSAYNSIANWIEKTFGKTGVYDFMLSCYFCGLNTFSMLNDKYDLNIELNVYLNMYRDHRPQIHLTEDVKEIINKLHRANIVLGIITDGRQITQQNKIEALGLKKYMSIDNILVSEAFGFSKPNKEAYLYFENKYPDGEYFYIGDNTNKDFVAPNLLNWETICLLDTGDNIHKQVFQGNGADPKYVIKSFIELEKIISLS